MEKNNNNRKNLFKLLITIVLILAIPAVLYLVQQVQIFKPKAANDSVIFTGPNVVIQNNVQKLKLDDQGNATVGLQITSPIGPPAQ